MLEKVLGEEFIKIIREELVPAFGCTEPIALAYASAKCREALGCEPEKIIAKCSGNMIKNVRFYIFISVKILYPFYKVPDKQLE